MESPQSSKPVISTGQEIHMNVRTISSLALAGALMATTAGVYAAQKFDQITVLGKTVSVPHIEATTDGVYAAQKFDEITVLGKTVSVPNIASSIAECKVNMTRENGRTYCFSNDKALDAFMNDAPISIDNGKEPYGFRGA
jgi:hypothetical protein